MDLADPLAVRVQGNISAAFPNISPPHTGPAAGASPSTHDMLITSILGSVLISMCVVGVIGNIYTLVIMKSTVRVTGSMYIYVLNLALADLLYLSTVPFVVWTYFAKDWYFGDVGCRILFSLDFVTMHASIFILTVMSTERYLAVVKPLHTFARSRRYRRGVTCLVWLFSFVLALPTMIMIDLKTEEHGGVEKHMCHPTWQITTYRVYLTVLFHTCILAPGLIIGFLYWKLARTYWLSQASLFPSRHTQKCHKQKVLLMIFSIVLVYWACFLPFWLWQLLSVYYYAHRGLHSRTLVFVNFVVTCLAYSNSCINPFLYTLLTKNYQEYVLERQKSTIGLQKRFRGLSLRSSGSQQFTMSNTHHEGALNAYSKL